VDKVPSVYGTENRNHEKVNEILDRQ
jgi:hypothetical protein